MLSSKKSSKRRVGGNRVSLNRHRLLVHRSSKHIYAHLFSLDGSRVLASVSTLDKTIVSQLSESKEKLVKTAAASLVGKFLAEKSVAIGINKVYFDRAGFLYHGRVKALADSARSAGLIF